MSNSLGFSFDHVHIYCTDLSATERWFVDCMGAEVSRRREVKGAAAVDLKLAGVDIFLRGPMPGESFSEAKPNHYGTNHIGFRVSDLDATVAELKRRGTEFDTEPYWISPVLKVAFVKGPDEIRIELLQRVDNK